MQVQLFIPLVVDQCCPEVAFDAISLLESVGCDVNVVESQTSSGEEIYASGFWPDAREVGEKFLNDFSSSCPIIVPSVESAAYIKNQMGKLFENSSKHNKYKELANQTYELSSFLVEHLNIDNFNAMFKENVAVHPSCSYSHTHNYAHLLERILNNVKALNFYTVDQVCAWKESLYIDSDSADKLAEDLLQQVIDQQTQTILVNDPNCLVNLKAIAARQKQTKQLNIKYFASILV